MDDCGAKPRPVTSVALINMLDDLFAPFMFKVHINIGRFIARFGDKAFKDHGADLGADRGYAKTIAHHRIGRRTAPLTENIAGARKMHNIAHRQEIGFIFQLGNEGEFML